MAKTELGENCIIVHAEWREREMVKLVPGVRYSHRTQTWAVPLSWASLAALRGVFGSALTLDQATVDWGWTQRSWIDAVAAIKVEEDDPDTPFAFQERGIEFLRIAKSGLLADEMGLGKSRQAVLAVERDDAYPTLVVCPNSMKYAWQEEWAKWAGHRNVVVLDGTAAQKLKALASDVAEVFIVNWEGLRSLSRQAPYGSIKLTDKQKTPGPLNREWACVIADEAHRGKDPTSQQTRALWAVGQGAARRIALSGTPMANSPADIWSIMHFVMPAEWPSRTAFIDRYCVASFNFWGTLDVHQLHPATRAEMDSFFLPRFFRRTKAEVLTQLPPKTYQTRYVTMAPAQRKVYESLRKTMLAQLDSGILLTTDPLTQTLRLLQTASALPELGEGGQVVRLGKPSCKLAALQELLEECAGEPLVVFAASRKLIELISEEVDVDHILITGGQTPAERAGSVARFQTGSVALALVTLGAGGEGITLTAASRAAFLQRSWSLVQNLQAEDRIHRIGQTASSIEILDIVSADTIEARVHEAFADKELTMQDVVRDPDTLRRLLV